MKTKRLVRLLPVITILGIFLFPAGTGGTCIGVFCFECEPAGSQVAMIGMCDMVAYSAHCWCEMNQSGCISGEICIYIWEIWPLATPGPGGEKTDAARSR